MIQLYCGDGKGKTTAAMGQAIRAAGRGFPVVIAQFLKSENTGERNVLEKVAGITLLPVPEQVKFSFAMDETERGEAEERNHCLLRQIDQALENGAAMAILDEACAAMATGLLEEEDVVKLLDRWTERELILTGRNPPESLIERADYITEMRALRHPYEKGITARLGIEY